MGAWSVYLLCCADGTLYAGVTTDLARRLREHNAGNTRGARYTRSRRPVQLIHSETAANRAEACRREAAIKKLTREAKLALVAQASRLQAGQRPALQPLPEPQTAEIQSDPRAGESQGIPPLRDITPALQSTHDHP